MKTHSCACDPCPVYCGKCPCESWPSALWLLVLLPLAFAAHRLRRWARKVLP